MGRFLTWQRTGRGTFKRPPCPQDRGAVLLVANYASDVGYAWWLMENFWEVIAREMAAQGRRCHLAYPEVRDVPIIVRDAPLQIVKLRVTWAASRQVLKFLRRERIRAVYVTDWPYVHWIYAVWRLAGVRRIVLHDHKPGDRPPAGKLKRLVLWGLHSSGTTACTGYVAVSKYVGQRLQNSACVPARRCHVVENGIEVFELQSSRQRVRHSLGIPETAILIAMVSRATLYKGLDFAIECFQRLQSCSPRWPDIYVVHCGDGPDLDRFRDQASAAGLGQQVRFLGRRTDVRELLCASDLAFHPSRGEGLSLAILEFMCAALPVVVPDRPSVCAPVIDDETGIVYPRDAAADACRAILRLAGDSRLRERMGAAARERVRTHFSLARTRQNFALRVVPLL